MNYALRASSVNVGPAQVWTTCNSLTHGNSRPTHNENIKKSTIATFVKQRLLSSPEHPTHPGTAGSATFFSLIAFLIVLWTLKEPEIPVYPPCPHAPYGCCRHNTQQMTPDCNPDCNRREHQCPGRHCEGGGSIGPRVEFITHEFRYL